MIGVHQVVVWVGTGPGGVKQFTITARKPSARLGPVERQVAAAGFTVKHREPGLTKQRANELKRELVREYTDAGYARRPRNPLPLPM